MVLNDKQVSHDTWERLGAFSQVNALAAMIIA
jgi:hypothetical protein